MPRRLWWLAALLMFAALLAGCENETEDGDTGGDDADDDNDTEEPAPSDPWNHEPDRPRVTITSPPPGAFVTGDAVTVLGTVAGVPVDEVTINGETAPVVGGVFENEVSFADDNVVQGINVLAMASTGEAPAGGARVAVVRGEMAALDEPVTAAFLAALGDQALTTVNDLLADALADLDLLPLLEPLNPIIDTPLLKVSVTAASIGGVDVQSEFRADGFGFSGDLLDVTFGLEVTILGLPSETTVTIGEFHFEGLADLLVNDGGAEVTISQFDLSHTGVTFDGPLPAFLGQLLTDFLLGILEGAVELGVTTVLPPALEGLLDSLVYEDTAFAISLYLELATLDIADGALAAGFTLNAFLTDPDPTVPWPRGSLKSVGAPPDLLDNRPAAAEGFGFATSLSDDVLNRALVAVADSHLFDLAIGGPGTQNDAIPIELTAGALATIFPTLGAVDPSVPASLTLTANAPPVALPAEDGRLTIQVPDWRLGVYLHPDEHGPWRAMELSVGLIVAVDADAADGALVLGFPQLEMSLFFLDNPLNEDASFAAWLADWLPELLAGLLDTVFGELPIDLPAFGGVDLSVLWWGTAGPQADYWTSYFGLDYSPAH